MSTLFILLLFLNHNTLVDKSMNKYWINKPLTKDEIIGIRIVTLISMAYFLEWIF